MPQERAEGLPGYQYPTTELSDAVEAAKTVVGAALVYALYAGALAFVTVVAGAGYLCARRSGRDSPA
jgi:hypothetical protein